MPRSVSGEVFRDKVLKLKEAQKQLEEQGFKRSPVSLDDLGDLGLELQPDSCFEVVFRFFYSVIYDIVSGPEDAPGRW